MAVYKRDMVDINLETGNIHRSFLKHSIGYKDAAADHFGIRVFRNGEPVSLTGVSVQGIFMPPQGSPIAITSGNIVDGNVAEVVLPQACYNYDGQFTLSIKLVDATNAVTGTMRIVDGMVDNTHASGTVAPTSAVPTYQEILATYDAMVAATTAATTAATNVGSIVAAAYSTSATYAVGDYCTKDGNLYRCTTAITTAESWTAANWTQTKMGPDVSDLKSAFKIITDNDYGLSVVPSASWTDNYYIDLSGSTVNIASPVSANTMRYIVCNCVPGEIFQINGQGGNDARLWAFADKNGNILSKENANTTRVDYLISAPTDSYYLISNFIKSYSPQSIKKVIEKKDSTLMSQYDEIEITDGWFGGGYYDVSGLTVDITTPVSASSMNAIVKECIEGEIFKVSGKGGNAGRLWAFADTGKNILTKELAGITTTNKQLIAPKNAAYIIVNTNNTTSQNVIKNTVAEKPINETKNETKIENET